MARLSPLNPLHKTVWVLLYFFFRLHADNQWRGRPNRGHFNIIYNFFFVAGVLLCVFAISTVDCAAHQSSAKNTEIQPQRTAVRMIMVRTYTENRTTPCQSNRCNAPSVGKIRLVSVRHRIASSSSERSCTPFAHFYIRE